MFLLPSVSTRGGSCILWVAWQETAKQAMDLTVALMSENDTALFISGRNRMVYNYFKKEFTSLRPKLLVRELYMEPSEEAIMAKLRLERSRTGTIDVQDHYLAVTKMTAKNKRQRGEARRFTGGNTAFRCMSNLPLLEKEAMVKVPPEDRERCLRGVVGSDKFTPGGPKSVRTAGDEESDEEEEGEELEDSKKETEQDASGNVILFYMELHPRAAVLTHSSCAWY